VTDDCKGPAAVDFFFESHGYYLDFRAAKVGQFGGKKCRFFVITAPYRLSICIQTTIKNHRS